MLWLCLDFPHLSLEVFTRSEQKPEPNRPVILVDRGRIYCANQAARNRGVKPGQSAATAAALTNRLRIIERDTKLESRTLRNLAAWSYQFTPMVSLHPPSSLLLEISGSLRLFHGLAALQTLIDSGIGEMGYSMQQGIAPTPKGARLFSRLTAGETAITTDNYRQQLAGIGLGYLDTTDKQKHLLRDMGFTRLGELLDLPAHTLGKRFGQDFLYYLQQLSGDRPDPLQPVTPDNHFHSELFFIEGLNNRETLLFPMKRLLEEFSRYLQIRQLNCRRFCWHLTRFRGNGQPLDIQLSRPQNDVTTFFALTRIKLETLSLQASIHSISLSARNFSPAQPGTATLLDKVDRQTPGMHAESAALLGDKLRDKLSTRLGSEALYGISGCDEHVPELAWRATGTGCPQKRTATNSNTLPPAQPVRPFWLMPEPKALSHRNQQLYWQGYLTLLRGPERIDSNWWRQPVQRDYFIARHENGGLYWVFREITSKRWFVHGIFN